MSPEEMLELRQLLIIAGKKISARRQQSMCQGKQGFETFEHAMRAIHGFNAREMHPYQCGHCRQWHIGRRRDRKARAFEYKRRKSQ